MFLKHSLRRVCLCIVVGTSGGLAVHPLYQQMNDLLLTPQAARSTNCDLVRYFITFYVHLCKIWRVVMLIATGLGGVVQT